MPPRARVVPSAAMLSFALLSLLPASLLPPAARAAVPAGDSEPLRLQLVAPPGALHPGETARLTLRLAGEKGAQEDSARELEIELSGGAELGLPAQVKVPAGTTEVELELRPRSVGVFRVEAGSRGLFSAHAVIAVAPPASPSGTAAAVHPASPAPAQPLAAAPASGPTASPRAEVSLPPSTPAHVDPRLLSGVSAPSSSTSVPVRVAPSGAVELIAQPTSLHLDSEGWELATIDVFWFENGSPAVRASDLAVDLVAEGRGSGAPQVSPRRLVISGGAIRSDQEATVRVNAPVEVRLRALYAGGEAVPVDLHFLPAEPAAIELVGVPPLLRGLGEVEPGPFVRLVDAAGEPVAAADPLAVTVTAAGSTGNITAAAQIAAGEFEAPVDLALDRHGEYTLTAASRLGTVGPVRLRYAVDWLVIAVTLAGGALGSLTRVLYRQRQLRPRALVRILVLGLVAALLLLLLSTFGLLSLVDGALPIGVAALAEIPTANLAGALLLGFLAGLLFDRLFGRLLAGGEAAGGGG